MTKLTLDKKKKTCSVKDFFNKKEIDFKAINLNDEKDIYTWSEHWRKKRLENK